MTYAAIKSTPGRRRLCEIAIQVYLGVLSDVIHALTPGLEDGIDLLTCNEN